MSLFTSRAYPLALQLTEPSGFWASASHGAFGQNFAKQIQPLCAGSVCPPPVENSAALVVTTPVVDGQGVGTKRLSNLDLNGKLVKRGRIVSYHGLRGLVTKVKRGRCVVNWLTHTLRPKTGSDWVVCEQVQVVA